MRTQDVRNAGLLLVCLLLITAGCKRAERYGVPLKTAKQSSAPNDEKVPEPRVRLWQEGKESWDIPIVFVPATAPEWAELPRFWNLMPRPGAALAAFLGTPPVLWPALRLLDPVQVKIKVPLGLPDPTPLLAAGNPPTLAKWQLGKELFFEDIIQMEKAERLFSCSTCHNPAHGFAENAAVSPYMNRNAPSLINVVYNRRQFWDGRAEVLEETIARDPGDARARGTLELPKKHNFVELAKALRENERYRKRFQEVFGIREPTPDAAAKALATYMRTILSANSIIDRADHERGRKKGVVLTPDHFKSVLAADDLGALGLAAKEAAERLEHGYRLFTGKAQCAVCHPLNGLFTDHDFHNIGLRQERVEYELGNEEGRIATVPVGLKEPRLVGAFRTPSLRALPHTGPYMHDGGKDSLAKVVEHFNSGIVGVALNPYLARPLLAAPDLPRRLNLDEGERAALVLFLEALDGSPVDPVVSGPPPKAKP
jgi:cytochrome c peroxidase